MYDPLINSGFLTHSIVIGGMPAIDAYKGLNGSEAQLPVVGFETTYDDDDQITNSILHIEIPLKTSVAFFSRRDLPSKKFHVVNFGEIGLSANKSIFPTNPVNAPEFHTSFDTNGNGFVNVKIPIDFEKFI